MMTKQAEKSEIPAPRWGRQALPKGEAPRVSGEIEQRTVTIACREQFKQRTRTRRTVHLQRGPKEPRPTTAHWPSKVVRCPPASAPLRARLGNRPDLRGRFRLRPCPPLRLCIAPRLGPACSACVLLPAQQVSRLRRLPFAAVAHSGYAACSSRRCAYTPRVVGMAYRPVDLRKASWPLVSVRTPALEDSLSLSRSHFRMIGRGIGFGFPNRRVRVTRG